MASITLSPNIRTHVDLEPVQVEGASVREALDNLFTVHPRLRGYLLDDHGAVRKHIAVFLGGATIQDRKHLSDPLLPESEIFIMQALSGG